MELTYPGGAQRQKPRPHGHGFWRLVWNPLVPAIFFFPIFAAQGLADSMLHSQLVRNHGNELRRHGYEIGDTEATPGSAPIRRFPCHVKVFGPSLRHSLLNSLPAHLDRVYWNSTSRVHSYGGERVMTVPPFRPRPGRTERKFDLDIAIDRFLSAKRIERRSPRTIKSYSDEFSRFKRRLDRTGIQSITPDTMARYIEHLTYEKVKWDDHPTNPSGDPGLSARTVNNTIRNLKNLFNWCVKEGYFSTSPMDNISYQPEDNEHFHVFSDEQVMRLLQQPNRRTFIGMRDYCMMLCLIDTGMRIGELTSLKVSDIDFELNQIVLPGTITKNGHTRIAPISPVTSKALRELIAYCNLEPGDFLWVSQFGERYMADTFAKMLKSTPERRAYKTFGFHRTPSATTLRRNFSVTEEIRLRCSASWDTETCTWYPYMSTIRNPISVNSTRNSALWPHSGGPSSPEIREKSS
ncbi:integrase family protein [Alicyclobacillus hesperidum URH17-3-68]|nr:integrase family protein [Alicyclobacillus hesperidum URH17-3-68]